MDIKHLLEVASTLLVDGIIVLAVLGTLCLPLGISRSADRGDDRLLQRAGHFYIAAMSGGIILMFVYLAKISGLFH